MQTHPRPIRFGVAALPALLALLAPGASVLTAGAAEAAAAAAVAATTTATTATPTPPAAAGDASTAGTTAAAPTPPKLRLPAGAHPVHYDVTMALDPNKETFTGTARLQIEAEKTLPLLWLNASKLEITRAAVVGGAGDDRPKSTMPAVRVIPGGESFAGFTFDPPLSPGRFILEIDYSGAISVKEFSGLFREKEEENWYLYSQFESIDARSAFPCFDEPHYKVPWQFTLKIPKETTAVSNTPILEETTEGATKTVRFAETKPLPSYLLAFAVGPFDYAVGPPLGSKKIPFRVVTPKGQANRAKYTLETTPEFIKVLEAYFGMPYPYDKLDLIAIPIFGGGMENAGAITFSRGILLTRPDEETPSRQRTFNSVGAHELAHMWFGDLVTTDWWDDIWLNEAFADWMENKVIEQWHPEEDIEVARARARGRAMGEDGYITARRIRQPIEAEADIESAFDSITYAKGSSVLDMFELWIGSDTFRKGVRRHIAEHAHKTATADDFLASISAEAGKDVAPAFRTFLDQGGLPLVSFRVTCGGGSPRLKLAQRRYLPAGSKGSTSEIWKIPVCVRYGGAKEGAPRDSRQCLLLETQTADVVLEGTTVCPDWILLNDGERGYYRPRLEEDPSSSALTVRGNAQKLFDEKMGVLSTAERVGAFDDLSALVDAGEIPAGDVLALVPKVMSDGTRHTVRVTSSFVQGFRSHLVSSAMRVNYERFVRQTYGDRARKLGWEPLPGESEETRLLRPDLIGLVGGPGEDKELQKQARVLAERWLKDKKAVWPDMVGTVMSLSARHGDQAWFDRLLDLARKEKDRTRRGVLLGALASFRDPAIVQKRLNILLGDDFDVRELRGFYGADPDLVDLRFDFVKKNYDALAAKLPDRSTARLIRIGSDYCDDAHRAEVESTFRDRAAKAFGGERVLDETLEQIDLCIASRKAQQESVETFLKKY